MKIITITMSMIFILTVQIIMILGYHDNDHYDYNNFSDHWVLEQASASLPDAWLSGEDKKSFCYHPH